jgi:RHS repeat-associated protein
MTKVSWTQEQVLVDICNGDGDRYRWGFNGQEKVNEWSGIGNYLDFAHRGYDSRTGRFNSRDPFHIKYPHYSDYQFAGNMPINSIDMEGLEPTRPPLPGEKKTLDDWSSGYGNEFQMSATNRQTGKKQNYWVFQMEAPNFNWVYYYNDQGKWHKFYDVNQVVNDRAKAGIATADFIEKGFTGLVFSMVAAPVIIESGLSSVVYSGAKWTIRNYGVTFLKESRKELIANWRDPSKFDFSDVMVNTATSKMGFGVKALGGAVNSVFDANVHGINFWGSGKSTRDVMFDLSVESMKIGLDKSTNGEFSKSGADMFLDQAKGEANELMQPSVGNKSEKQGDWHSGQNVYGK